MKIFKLTMLYGEDISNYCLMLGNDRFAQLCRENNFDFVLRISGNLNIQIGENLDEITRFIGNNEKLRACVFAWDKKIDFEVTKPHFMKDLQVMKHAASSCINLTKITITLV